MSPLIVRSSDPPPGATDQTLVDRTPVVYHELALRSRRVDRERVELWVSASPAGAMKKPVLVPANEGKLRRRELAFQAPIEHAVELGSVLAKIMLVEPVYGLLKGSLRRLGGSEGLRVRLDLDSSLIDLPWEYVYRPEVRGSGVSGFLFLDPKVSLVRAAARRRDGLEPSNRAQRLVFLGAYWAGGDDKWGVEDEFEKLSFATRPIGNFLSVHFADVVNDRAVAKELKQAASIFHYSGHSSRDAGGSFLVREGGETGDGMPWYVDQVAPMVARAGARLALLSACNSGEWGCVKPFLDAGVPAVVGMQGAIETRSATLFTGKFYSALAVGLSLDEAATYARLHVVTGGTLPCDWGRPMVYLATRDAVLFPRPATHAVRETQQRIRGEGSSAVADIVRYVASLSDRGAIGAFVSQMARRQVLILGRFRRDRKEVLDTLRERLAQHRHGYLPNVFDFEVPKGRRIGESVLSFASMSRFVIADISDPTSVPAELEKVINQLPSVPVQPILLRGQKPYALFEDHVGKRNVRAIVYYDGVDDLLAKLDDRIIGPAETLADKLARRKAA